MPVALKDLFCTRGIRTTCGSKILDRFVPPYDATVVARLNAAGAILLGKLNMDEFAMGSSTEHSAFGTTRNPWDLARVPGGSSGGASAVVAADLAALSLGTDTGGSIRQPAAFCGVLGMKPTYGRVSRYGVIAFASSLDQVGPFAKDVEDAALLLAAIAGADPMDSTAVDVPVPDYRAELGRGIEGMKIGVPAEYFIDGMDPEVERAVREAIAALEKLGARTEPVSLPHTEYGLAAYYVIAPAEASSNLARYDGVKYGLRAPGARDLIDMYSKTRAAGLRQRGQAPADAGHLRALRRLLRRLLRPGPEGPDPGAARLRAGLRARGPDRGAHHPGRGLQDGREGRSRCRCT